MFESKGQTKTKEFAQHISALLPNAHTNIVDGFQQSQRDLLTRFLSDTMELIEHNEWGVALENLLENLYEIDFKIDEKAIELAVDSIKAFGYDYEQWRFIEELKK